MGAIPEDAPSIGPGIVVPKGFKAHFDDAGVACTPCEPGTYSTSNAACSVCLNGKYADQSGTLICKDCPIGKHGTGIATKNSKSLKSSGIYIPLASTSGQKIESFV